MQKLLGLAGIARLIGRSRQIVSYWHENGLENLPEPFGKDDADRELWLRKDIEKWKKSRPSV